MRKSVVLFTVLVSLAFYAEGVVAARSKADIEKECQDAYDSCCKVYDCDPLTSSGHCAGLYDICVKVEMPGDATTVRPPRPPTVKQPPVKQPPVKQ